MSRIGRDELLPIAKLPPSVASDRSPRASSPRDGGGGEAGPVARRSRTNGKISYKRLIVGCDGEFISSALNTNLQSCIAKEGAFAIPD
jgi:hypothetical protein